MTDKELAYHKAYRAKNADRLRHYWKMYRRKERKNKQKKGVHK